MPRYLVEREFPQGLEIPTTPEGQKAMLGVVDNNATEQVTWVQSFVTVNVWPLSHDLKTSSCA